VTIDMLSAVGSHASAVRIGLLVCIPVDETDEETTIGRLDK